jgi:hypothetical protein
MSGKIHPAALTVLTQSDRRMTTIIGARPRGVRTWLPLPRARDAREGKP